jgi:beta-lactamase superfamily II metal-dependent hydrolase
MAEKFSLPSKKGVVFWPVGTGDSTTLILKPGELIMQIDLRHLEKADDPDEPEWPIVDHLVRILPKKDGKPYLAVFALTHPDKDHIQGFAELLKKVQIGELWHTPKIFRDHHEDDEVMCEDALAFRKEAHRRRAVICENPDSVPSGDRLRVIGHDDILEEDEYVDLPDTAKSRPGELVKLIDGVDLSGHFEAFLHAPFKDDQAANKNNTSLSMNVVLREGKQSAQFFFFGDREYPTTKRIFADTEDYENTEYLAWDVMLSSHHCSKGVMYWQEEGDEDAVLKQDILDYFEKYAKPGAVIVTSSHSDFTDESGDNPPHLKARKRYEEIVDAGNFICTHEYPNKADPKPLTFVLDESGLKLDDKRSQRATSPAFGAAIKDARGSAQPPGLQVGFGREE